MTALRPAHRPMSLATLGHGALVAASAGLALTTAAPAVAAPEAAQVDAPIASRTSAVAVSPTIVVPEDAEWTLETVEVTAEEPAPEPEPAARETSSPSRSADRAALDAAPAPASASAAALLEIARRYQGVPYVYGGATPSGFDCSGFTMYVYAQLGISLPRSSADQRYAGTVVSAAEARPGDLVWAPGHVGIYTGNGNHIAARQPGTPLYEGPLTFSPTYIRVL